MGLFATLNAQLLGRGTWPPPVVRAVWEDVELLSAFRTSDDERIRMEASVSWQDRYMLSPVPRMISRASANMLFGEPPEFQAANDSDQDRLDFMVEEQDLVAELHRAALISSSEGEAWGRIVVQPELIDCPIIEFVSRRRVIPHFRGRFVVGATFVTEWATGAVERFRLLETYEPGAVTCVLYRGSRTSIGTKVSLDSFDETKGRAEQVLTGIDRPLVAFIPNTIDSDPTRGYADYHGLRDRFLALNEAATVGQGNLRLAGQKRAMVDAGYLNDRGQLPTGDDVFIRTSREGGDGTATRNPIDIIDYSFDSGQTIGWIDHLIDSTLSFAGIAPQSVGRGVDGGAISGTALKLKMSHSLMEAAGKGRFFDRGVTRLLAFAQVIDGRSVTEGGFGRGWVARDEPPAVELGDPVPRDDMEAAAQLQALVGAEAISLEQRVAFLHPNWSDDQIGEEVVRLREENAIPVAAGFDD